MRNILKTLVAYFTPFKIIFILLATIGIIEPRMLIITMPLYYLEVKYIYDHEREDRFYKILGSS